MYYSVTQHILYLITDVQVFIKAQIDLTKKSIDTSKEINYTPGFLLNLWQSLNVTDFLHKK